MDFDGDLERKGSDLPMLLLEATMPGEMGWLVGLLSSRSGCWVEGLREGVCVGGEAELGRVLASGAWVTMPRPEGWVMGGPAAGPGGGRRDV